MTVIFAALTAVVWIVLAYYGIRAIDVYRCALRMERDYVPLYKVWKRCREELPQTILHMHSPDNLYHAAEPNHDFQWMFKTVACWQSSSQAKNVPRSVQPGPYLTVLTESIMSRDNLGLAPLQRQLEASLFQGVERELQIGERAKGYGLQGTLIGIAAAFTQLNEGFSVQVLVAMAMALATTAVGMFIHWLVEVAVSIAEAAAEKVAAEAEAATLAIWTTLTPIAYRRHVALLRAAATPPPPRLVDNHEVRADSHDTFCHDGAPHDAVMASVGRAAGEFS